VEFEWDPAKAEANLRKHGVSLDFATGVFFDPHRIEQPEDCDYDGEIREQVIGLVQGFVLFVVFTVRFDTIRIISATNTGMVRFRYDPDNPPTMTEEQLQTLRDLRDEDIDLSEMPERLTGWRRVSDLVPDENKQQVTLRLDADLLAYFKSTGKRYQSRINAVLRAYMLAQRDSL
jgi:uncharacterized DUF497 family protein/uncharacterized protein (DUF4415 family)